ncbi:MAG: 50S ribosomal protein L11 methyltransferase [Chloroflexota bacterium]|nr:50S ribosomal protein L11 methyltransferase [Chloroflexota bacterium]
MPDRWLEVSIRATAEAAEALTALFQRAGHGGVVIEPELRPGAEVDEVEAAPGAFAVLRTYLPEGQDVAPRRKHIEDSVGILRAFDLAPMGELTFRWIGEEDWANAWKRHYSVQRIGRRWVIKPRWQAYTPGPDDLVLDLDPGMAFGTGLHPTTQLVLECLETLPQNDTRLAGQHLLDLGTGSGILSIAAARLGARSVLALDVDDVAVTATRENAAHNGVQGVITAQRATVGSSINGVVTIPGLDLVADFDGAFANIVARVIAERAPALARALRPGAWLLASGIIADRESEAAEPLAAHGFITERRLQRGDWVTLLCRRDASAARADGVGVARATERA